MDKHELVLEDHDPKIFQSLKGKETPFQFTLYIPPDAIEVVRLAADQTRRQLINIIPGFNHTITVTDNINIDGEMVLIHSTMLILELYYTNDSSKHLTFQFSAQGEDLVLH